MPTFVFFTALLYGAYPAAELHIHPWPSLPSFLQLDCYHLLILQLADSFNMALYLGKANSFNPSIFFKWLALCKLFIIVHLAVTYDDRLD